MKKERGGEKKLQFKDEEERPFDICHFRSKRRMSIDRYTLCIYRYIPQTHLYAVRGE